MSAAGPSQRRQPAAPPAVVVPVVSPSKVSLYPEAEVAPGVMSVVDLALTVMVCTS